MLGIIWPSHASHDLSCSTETDYVYSNILQKNSPPAMVAIYGIYGIFLQRNDSSQFR